jgi:Bacterial toxin 4
VEIHGGDDARVAVEATPAADVLTSPGLGGAGASSTPPAGGITPPPPARYLGTPIVQRQGQPQGGTVTRAVRSDQVGSAGDQPLPEIKEGTPWTGPEEILPMLDALPRVLQDIRAMRWDVVAAKAGNPAALFQPKMATVFTDSHQIDTDSRGNPLDIKKRDQPAPGDEKRGFLIQMSTGDTWILNGAGDRVATVTGSPNHPEIATKVEAGVSSVVVIMPGINLADDEVAAVNKRIAETIRRYKMAAGPPGWATGQGKDVRDAIRAREATRNGTQALSPGGPATGTGETGKGPGGGQDSKRPDPRAGHPATDRKGADDVAVTVDGDGTPVVVVTADGAKSTIPMHQGESTAKLLERADKAGDALRVDRRAESSVRLQNGATTLRMSPPPGSGGGTEIKEADKTAKESGGPTPGEKHQGKGDANTPAYPSEIRTYGMQPPKSPITVTGATNDFTMELDRGPDPLSYFQEFHFYWELIEVTRIAADKRAAALANVPVGMGREPGSGDLQDIAREAHAIAEDFHNSSWLEIAAEYQLIGLSAGVRMIGSVLKAFFASMTRPLNEQAIGFDHEGDFILRCVATPQVDREWLAEHGIPREQQTIRASSISVLPIRIQNIDTRAKDVNRQDDDAIKAKEAELAKAIKDGKSKESIDALRLELEQMKRRLSATTPAWLGSTIDDATKLLKILDELEDDDKRNIPFAERTTDALELDVGLRMAGVDRTDFRKQQDDLIKSRTTQMKWATAWGGAFKKPTGGGEPISYHPRVTFASEVNGQVIQMVMSLGEHDDSTPEHQHWMLLDVTAESTRQKYHGRSSKGGVAGRDEAIRNAFVDFRENGEYGRGTIAIRLPEALGSVPMEEAMRAAPGVTGREMQRLSDLAKAAMLAALVVGGPVGLAIGAAGGIAGAVVAAHRMSRRAAGDRLHLDFETFMDIVDIVGGVISVVQIGTGIIGQVARAGTALKAGATTEKLGKAAASYRWVQRIEMTDRALHVFGIVQGIGQVVIIIPLSLNAQLEAIEKSDASPGRKRAQRALAMAQALQSGTIAVITTAQALSHGMPEVTSDAVVWDRLAAATAEAKPTVPVETVPTVRGAPGPVGEVPTGRAGKVGAADKTGAGAKGTSVEEGGPGAGRRDPGREPIVIKVEPPPGVGGVGGADGAPAHDGPAAAGPATVPETPAGPTPGTPATTPPAGLGAGAVLAAARRIISGNMAEPPPSGRIRYVPEVEFAPRAGEPGVVGLRELDGSLTISLERAQAAGVVPRLRALVEARAHGLARTHLGEPLAAALMNRIVSDVVAGHPGLSERTPADAILDRLQGEVGMPELLDAMLHGNIGTMRDRLRERHGAARADAIMAAAKAGSLDTMSRLLQPAASGFVDGYGAAAVGAVADLLTSEAGGRPRDPSRLELARALEAAVGREVVREAFMTGDTKALDAALDVAVGPKAATDLRSALRRGSTADARAVLETASPGQPRHGPADLGTSGVGPVAEPRASGPGAAREGTGPAGGGAPATEPGAGARTTGGEPIQVPDHAAAAARALEGAISGDPAAAQSAARRLVEDLHNFQLLRRLVEGGSIGTAANRGAIKDSLQAARNGVVDHALAGVKSAVEARHPGIEIRFQDLGTPGFGSDRDMTLRAEPARGAKTPPSTNELVAASVEAVRDAYQALREQGFNPDTALDTNFYTELHEGQVVPRSAEERAGISADQSIVSLTEMRLGMTDAQWRAHRDAQRRAIEESKGPDRLNNEIRANMERQFSAAEDRAARLGRGEQALQGARQRLLEALGRTPQPSARELRNLMADVKLLEPDAFGTRAAVEGVVYGQQGMTRAANRGEQAQAGEHMGTVGSGKEVPIPEQLGNRTQQAEAELGHFWSHFPDTGLPTPSQVRALAKQLGRIAHAFREAGLSYPNRLVDETGSVVGAKAEASADAATLRELRSWAEDTSQSFGSDEALLRAYASEAARTASDMTARLRTSYEAARFIHPEGDLGGGQPAPRSPGSGSSGPTGPTGPTGPSGPAGGPGSESATGSGAGKPAVHAPVPEPPAGPATPAPDGGPGATSRLALRDQLAAARPDIRARFEAADRAFSKSKAADQQGATLPSGRFDDAIATLDRAGMGEAGRAIVESMLKPGQGEKVLSQSRLNKAIAQLERVAELVTQRPDLVTAAGQAQQYGNVYEFRSQVEAAFRRGQTLEGNRIANPKSRDLAAVMRRMNEAFLDFRQARHSDPVQSLFELLRLQGEVARAAEVLRSNDATFSSKVSQGDARASSLVRRKGVQEREIVARASGRITEPLARDLPGMGLERYALRPEDLGSLPTKAKGLGEDLAALLADYHRAHLVGPGFGGELYEGMMLAPRSVNLELQNKGVETFIRTSRSAGLDVTLEVRAVGRRLEIPLEDGSIETIDILREVHYTIRGVGDTTYRVSIEITNPPGGAGKVMSTIPENAPGGDVLAGAAGRR